MALHLISDKLRTSLRCSYAAMYDDIKERHKSGKKNPSIFCNMIPSTKTQLLIIYSNSFAQIKEYVGKVHKIREIIKGLMLEKLAPEEEPLIFTWSYPDYSAFDYILAYSMLSREREYSSLFSSSKKGVSNSPSLTLLETEDVFSKLNSDGSGKKRRDLTDTEDDEEEEDFIIKRKCLNISAYRRICNAMIAIALPDKIYATPRFIESRHSPHTHMRAAYFAFLSFFVDDDMLLLILQQQNNHKMSESGEFFRWLNYYAKHTSEIFGNSIII